jgi:hypothetical protein
MNTKYALIQILGDGDDISVVTTGDNPVTLMMRGKQLAEEVAQSWFEDTRGTDPDATRPRVTTRFHGTTLPHFSAHIDVEDLANSWQISPIMEQLS